MRGEWRLWVRSESPILPGESLVSPKETLRSVSQEAANGTLQTLVLLISNLN